MFFMKNYWAKQRRQFPRVPTYNLIALDLPQRPVFNLIDLSENGLQFTSFRRFERGESLSLDVNLAEAGTRFSVLCRVVWVRALLYRRNKAYRIGLVFLELSESGREVVRRFLEPVLKAA